MNTELQLGAVHLPIGSLDAYIARVNAMPMLSKQEEVDYATELQENGDLQAAKNLVLAHLKYVVKVARGYLGYGLPLGDLIQEGNAGLMKAVKRFDPKVGVRLVSFAVHWIKAEIHEFVLKNWRIVKVATTKAQRKLFFNLRSKKKRLGWMSNDEVEMLANDLNVSKAEVLRMEQRLSAMDAPYDRPTNEDEEYRTPMNYLEDHSQDPALLVENEDTAQRGERNIMAAMDILDERSRDILAARWLTDKKTTLHNLAAKYGVSAERIRQLEANAMKKMRAFIETTE